MEKRKVCGKCHTKSKSQEQSETEQQEVAGSAEDKKSPMNVPIIWMIGGPGSGKGVQSDKVAEKYGFCHVSPGGSLVREIRSRSQLSKSLLELVSSGNLPPTDVVLQKIKEEMYENLGAAKGFVVDGYPSTRDEGLLFEAEICPPSLILFLEVPSEILVSRLMKRARVSGRVDDNEESIYRRLEVYYDTKEGLFMEFQDRMKIINGNKPPAVVFDDIKQYIKPLLK